MRDSKWQKHGLRAARLTKITKMAFGNGGTNDKGEPVPLQGNEQALKNELLQKDIDGFAFMEPAKVRYTCTLGESELAGETINEARPCR